MSDKRKQYEELIREARKEAEKCQHVPYLAAVLTELANALEASLSLQDRQTDE